MEMWGFLSLRIARWGPQGIKLNTSPVGLHALHDYEAGPESLRILILVNVSVECSWGLLRSYLTSTTKGSRCGTRGDL